VRGTGDIHDVVIHGFGTVLCSVSPHQPPASALFVVLSNFTNGDVPGSKGKKIQSWRGR